MATFNGTDLDDVFVQSPVTDTTGDDIFNGGGGDDLIKAGLGSDIVNGDIGNDNLDGEEGNDILFGGEGDDILRGLEQDDFLDGNSGNDTLWGGSGNDTLIDNEGTNRLSGGFGDDYIYTLSGFQSVNGGGAISSGSDGNDVFVVGSTPNLGPNEFSDEGGDNRLFVNAGDDEFSDASVIYHFRAGGDNTVAIAGAGNLRYTIQWAAGPFDGPMTIVLDLDGFREISQAAGEPVLMDFLSGDGFRLGVDKIIVMNADGIEFTEPDGVLGYKVEFGNILHFNAINLVDRETGLLPDGVIEFRSGEINIPNAPTADDPRGSAHLFEMPVILGPAGLVTAGTPSADRIDLTGQSNVDGGAGLDYGVLSGQVASFTVTQSVDGVTVAGPNGQIDTVNIERFEFDDGALAFDESAARAYRLYQAAFDREPDVPGLSFWIGEIDAGAEFNNVSARFIDSDEFRELYGTNPSAPEFINTLYLNVLDREADDAGKGFWIDQLNSGMSRAEVLARFSDSEENRANVAAQVDDGVFFLP